MISMIYQLFSGYTEFRFSAQKNGLISVTWRVGMKIIVTSGTGEGPTSLAAFDAALLDAGVANYNLICLSSIIPPGSMTIPTDVWKVPRAVARTRTGTTSTTYALSTPSEAPL